MRYNASELKQMAITSAQLCTKEGVLNLREKEGKLWNKTDVLTGRWCRLVDNLFFYFKTREKPTSSDPQGVFVLEGSHVRPVALQDCAFILEFDSDSRSTYFLASDPSEAKEWMKALEDASYTKLKQKYEMLKKQKENSGEASSLQPAVTCIRETRSANSSPLLTHRKKNMPKDHIMTLSDMEGYPERRTTKKKHKKRNKATYILPSDTVLPVLEIALSCAELDITKTIDQKRLIQIRVYCVQSFFSPLTDLKPVFSTDCVKPDTSVDFMSSLSFYQSHLITPDTILRFKLCQIKEKDTIDTLGIADCVVRDFFHLSRPLQILIKLQESHVGNLQLRVFREHVSAQLTKSSNENQLSLALLSSSVQDPSLGKVDTSYGDIGQLPNLKALYCEAISRTYRFPTDKNDSLSVQEIMLETRLSFHIPLLYLKLLIDQETRYIGTLNSIQHLVEHLKQTRNNQIKNSTNLIEKYQEAVKNTMECGRDVSFKASVQKTFKEYEFVPTNLHLQRMRVQHSDCISATTDSKNASSQQSTGIYDVITTGASTAHCLKYKHGGLLSLLAASSDKMKKSKENSLLLLSNLNSVDRDVSEFPVKLSELHAEVKSLVTKLERLTSVEFDTVTNHRILTRNTLSELSTKTCGLVSLLDNESLCKSIKLILNESNGGRAGNGNDQMSLPSGPSKEWEEKKTLVKTKLADIIKKIHVKIIDADETLVQIDDSIARPSPSFDDILSDLSELSVRLSSIANIAVQGHAVHTMITQGDSHELTYRRDVVFSQVLSACICGVATKVLSSIHDTEFLCNVAQHGILIQFESLLSTFKHELGMLEDYVVGVYDLQKVTFSCEKAREQLGDDMDSLLPTLHGTRNKINVKLHIHKDTFEKLPDSMKGGTKFKLIPVIFNVGMNEEQSIADKIGKTDVQENVNIDCSLRLRSYFEKMNLSSTMSRTLDDKLEGLNMAVNSKKKKNVEILHLASEVCRNFNGVRVSSCKSAKDRTAMSVTLEQVQVLIQNHGMLQSKLADALSCMRSKGTRLQNTKKNVGAPKYAFTSVQLMTFPKLYRPPDGTYGKADS